MRRTGAAKVGKDLRRSLSEIDRALSDFSASARAFSMSRAEALSKYENKWIAIYRGKVEAVEDTLSALVESIESKHIPAAETVFRRVDRKEKIYIL